MKTKHNRGYIETILLAIIIIATLSYFNIDLRGILDMPIIQNILGIFKGAWFTYLVPLWGYLVTSVTGLYK